MPTRSARSRANTVQMARKIHGVVQYAPDHYGFPLRLERNHMPRPIDTRVQRHARESPLSMINPDIPGDARRPSNPGADWISGQIRQRLFGQGPVTVLRLRVETLPAGRQNRDNVTAGSRREERLHATVTVALASTSASSSSNQRPRSLTSAYRPASRSSKPSWIRVSKRASLRCSRSACLLRKVKPAPTTSLASRYSPDATRSWTKPLKASFMSTFRAPTRAK